MNKILVNYRKIFDFVDGYALRCHEEKSERFDSLSV